MQDHNYYVYITTNKNKTVLYTGFSGRLGKRIAEHEEHVYQPSFSHRYNAEFVVYYEHFNDVERAIAREKEIKGWSRAKKTALIESVNLEWRFLNDEIKGFL
jgi:putative endonuclease